MGISRHFSTKMSQQVKVYGLDMGHSLHAYGFMRTKEENDKFKNLFMLALGEIAPGDVHQLQEWIALVQKDGKNNTDDKEIRKAVFGIA